MEKKDAFKPELIEAAFFDLDNTIIAGSSFLAYGRTLYKHGLIELPIAIRGFVEQAIFSHMGAPDKKIAKAQEFLLELTRGWNGQQVSKLVQETLGDIVVPIIYREAIEEIERQKQQGRKIIIVSSSPMELVKPLGEHNQLDVDDCIATIVKRDENGNFAGEFELFNYASQKPIEVKTYAIKHGIDLENSCAYSDSFTDVPLLECVGHPKLVNPDRHLARYAREQAWDEPLIWSNKIKLDDRKPPTFVQEHWKEIAIASLAVVAVVGGATAANNYVRSRQR